MLTTIGQIEDRYRTSYEQDQEFSSKSMAILEIATQLPQQYVEKALDTLAYQNRSDLLELLPTLRLIIMQLGEGEETFVDVLQSVREVCRQWP